MKNQLKNVFWGIHIFTILNLTISEYCRLISISMSKLKSWAWWVSGIMRGYISTLWGSHQIAARNSYYASASADKVGQGGNSDTKSPESTNKFLTRTMNLSSVWSAAATATSYINTTLAVKIILSSQLSWVQLLSNTPDLFAPITPAQPQHDFSNHIELKLILHKLKINS